MQGTSFARYLRIPAAILIVSSAPTAWSQPWSGIVTDSAGTPVSGALLKMERSGLTATSGPDGRFTLSGTIPVLREPAYAPPLPGDASSGVDAAGRFAASPVFSGIRFFRAGTDAPAPLAKPAFRAADFYDVLTAAKAGYLKSYLDLSVSESSTLKVKLLKEGTPRFSFFVTSFEAVQSLSGNPKGFGGDLRHGETGPGAGLRGADQLCALIAEKSMPASSFKGWRAFLSASSGVDGKEVNAIDRVGEGPWYDRRGRVVAMTKSDLSMPRPKGADAAILNDLPNENGYPNGYPKGGGSRVDNHHTLTGSKAGGLLYKSGSKVETCQDWTSSKGSDGKPRCGVSWPRNPNDSWIAWGSEGGCAPGINLVEGAPATEGNTAVGSNGGYGGWYCFALNP